MKLQLLSCSAPRPDARAIAKMLEEFAVGMDAIEAREQTGFLLEGDTLEIEVNVHADRAMRMIRKLSIEYDILDS
jgi:hypothetical protein